MVNFSEEKKTFILIIFLFFNLVLISTNVPLKNNRSLLTNTFAIIISPFQIVVQKSITFLGREFRRYIFLKNNFKKYWLLTQEYQKLKYENYLLRQQLTKDYLLNEVSQEITGLKRAEVVSIDQNFPLNSLYINKGSAEGIKLNMSVLNLDGDLVGKIVEPVTPFTAKVRLITSPIGGVGAYIETNKLEGLLTGNNNAECNFKYLIENKPVNRGDRVVTSGTDKIFPPFVNIGTVTDIQKGPLIQTITVRPYFIDKPIKYLFLVENAAKN